MAGDGVERELWERFARQHTPGRVSFLGHIQNTSDLADLLANVDAFVHPNPREPFGIAPLEAMASGVPLIAPDSGGIASYANHENAWVTQANVESFTQAVETVFANEPERRRRLENALRTAQEHSWERATGAFLDLYSDLHRAAINNSSAILRPSFTSTPAQGLGLACFRGASQGAERIFQIASSFFPRARS